jgi:hypothetical protein
VEGSIIPLNPFDLIFTILIKARKFLKAVQFNLKGVAITLKKFYLLVRGVNLFLSYKLGLKRATYLRFKRNFICYICGYSYGYAL